ncbi:hypothetical protein PROVRUST_06671 [Providencia rustigianii DSM 4541]|uniref:Uncharacterized protein n=1 Tax=Providencia rustigianii DSM 4541 TaxID=500637 RepID=D1P3R5_9GAMM|nr:hypothetical protein PROVRUST_06671 [Providencia rustigianii DSM 4541]
MHSIFNKPKNKKSIYTHKLVECRKRINASLQLIISRIILLF